MSRFGENNGKGIKPLPRTIRVRMFDNSELIRRLKRTTLIGKIMNPDVQSVGSLVLMMPRIWKLEGQVVGRDLGLGTFRLDFEREEDILEKIGNELGTVQTFSATVLLVLVFAMMKNLAHTATCTIMFRHMTSDSSQSN
ncbi:hypothetical protein AtNW77_Chr5g0122881 [Arabidopsis thaliana]|uniref:DUF4283 domain-containing protein n=1 Tax=Arabidopsis thaliana x Arabidopsis arenosa TaxID=1240361 RepID=A0A8T2D0Y3_9BRAS|nr:hypothetical protein ISN45_At05g035030 [Arabidopsis thaliana x Arabidopsis arenosa]